MSRRGRMHHEHQRRRGDHGDEAEVLQRVVRQLGVEVCVDRVGGDVLQPQRVAVGRGPDDEIAGDGGARAGLVVDDHRLAELLRERDGDGARQHVRDPAGGETHHEPYRLVRVVLRASGCRNEKENEKNPLHSFISRAYTPPAWRSTANTTPRSSTKTSLIWAVGCDEPSGFGGMYQATSFGWYGSRTS